MGRGAWPGLHRGTTCNRWAPKTQDPAAASALRPEPPETKPFNIVNEHFPDLIKRINDGITEVNAVLLQEERDEVQRAQSAARTRARASSPDNDARAAAPAPSHVPSTSMASTSRTRHVSISMEPACPFEAAELRARAAFDRAHPRYDADRAQAIADEDRAENDPLMMEKKQNQEQHSKKEEFKMQVAEWVNKNKESESKIFQMTPQQLGEMISLLEDDEIEELIGATLDEIIVQVAMDSGSVAHVIHPDDLPAKSEIIPKGEHEKDFTGAGGDRIKKHGTCKTIASGTAGDFTTDWQAADVTRALHSVSKVCGPKEHETGLHDVLFNNTDCFVVPPGVVRAIMKKLTAVAHYKREGGLYLANLTLSSFGRQGRGE